MIAPLNKLFQSTHPHGVRPPMAMDVLAIRMCFNPRTHTGCDYSCNYSKKRDRKFQSTHPHGVRREVPTGVKKLPRVSIHAPTRGATGLTLQARILAESFNPRTHTGCDIVALCSICANMGFNPRTHTGCDVISICLFVFPLSFNPRTHTGCDIL